MIPKYQSDSEICELLLGTEKVYFITWPVENATRTFIELIRGGSTHFFKGNINGAEAFYELKMKFEMQNVSVWGQSCESCKKRYAWKDIF